jgi:hypothetical protein
MMAWLPFPFPSCPRCTLAWPRSKHKDCTYSGSFDVDPDRARVRCEKCYAEASVWDLFFYCSCGNRFRSDEVRAALNDVLATANLFERLVRENVREAQLARSMGQNSLRSWISTIATGIGGHIGALLGTLAGKLASYFFKRL